MQNTIKKLPKSALEITVEITPGDMQPYLQKAAIKMSEQSSIPGFRPGKAPYEQVVARFGAGKVWEEAAQLVVPKVFSEIARSGKLETIGSPEIEVIKLAPDNAFIFKATVPLLPEVTLGNYSSITLEKKPTEIPETKIHKALTDLQKMQTKETVVDRPAEGADKVVLDMSMSLDSVPLDGGVAKDHAVLMEEEYYIPGMKEQLHGLKKGDTKEFQLKFPKEHYQKMLAGKDVDFKIVIKDVFALERPPLDDAFANALGQPSLTHLKTIIKGNLETEAQAKEDQRQEIELLESAVSKTKFADVPDILINEETIKMLRELEDAIAQQGMGFEDYLKKINKSRDELRLDFIPEATKRVKVALLIRKLALTQNITVTDPEIDEEVARVIELYKDAPEQHEQIKSPGARQYLAGMLQNRKVIAWLKTQVKTK